MGSSKSKSADTTSSSGAAAAPPTAPTAPSAPPTPAESAYLSALTVDRAHVLVPIFEVYDAAGPLAGGKEYGGAALLVLFDECDITPELLSHWLDFSGYRMFDTVAEARIKLVTVCAFADAGSNTKGATAKVQSKFRTCVKLLKDGHASGDVDPRQLLCMLASHGGVCNVMKTVAVDTAYALLTNTAAAAFASVTLEQQVMRLLRDLRELLVEENFLKAGGTTNTHPLIKYRNCVALGVGVERIVDPANSGSTWGLPPGMDAGVEVAAFFETYDARRVVEWVGRAVNEQPRRVKYQSLVDWLLGACPEAVDRMAFMEAAFDEGNGYVKEAFVGWMLQRLGVLAAVPALDMEGYSGCCAEEEKEEEEEEDAEEGKEGGGGEGKREGKRCGVESKEEKAAAATSPVTAGGDTEDNDDDDNTSDSDVGNAALAHPARALPTLVRQLSLGEASDSGGALLPGLPLLCSHLSLEEIELAKKAKRRANDALVSGLQERWKKTRELWRTSFAVEEKAGGGGGGDGGDGDVIPIDND